MIELRAITVFGQGCTIVNRLIVTVVIFLFYFSLVSCQQGPYNKTISTEEGCRVQQVSHELHFQDHFPDSVLCRLSSERIYLNSVRSENEGVKYYLLQSVDSIADGVSNYYESFSFTDGHFHKLPDISPVLPVFYKSYSKDYIRQLPDSVSMKYPYFGFGPIRNIIFNEIGVEISIEAFNGLGYKFIYELRDNHYVCTATYLQNFGTFYDEVKPVARDLFVGKRIAQFSYSELYRYFEDTEDL